MSLSSEQQPCGVTASHFNWLYDHWQLLRQVQAQRNPLVVIRKGFNYTYTTLTHTHLVAFHLVQLPKVVLCNNEMGNYYLAVDLFEFVEKNREKTFSSEQNTR